MKKMLKTKRFNKHKKVKRKLVILILLIFISAASLFSNGSVFAEDNTNAEKDLSNSIENILDNIDTKDLDEYLASLTEGQKSIFGSSSITERIRKIVSGDAKFDMGNFFIYLLEVLGVTILKFLPFIISILVICIAFNVISSVKGKFSSDSVENIVHFATLSLIVIIVLAQVTILIVSSVSMVTSIQKQMNIIFPIILTMMAATGAVSSVAVYQPSVAILSSGVTELISTLIIPCFILSIVFTVVGSVSEGTKLKKMSDFFSNAAKWLLGTVFFLFIVFLSVQGITASVYDGVSVRTAKFAISKYVPIIGGYLSEGLNLVMAGSVLVKNAVGMTAVILLFVSIAPILIEIILFNLSLHLTSAIVEPLGNTKISGLLTNLAKNMSMLVAIILGTAFLYFIFLILVVSTGNLAL